MDALTLVLGIAFFLAAMAYASVGNAGATSYLAVMSFFGLPHDEMRSTALVLNVLVASVATYKFVKADCFDGRLFWPFAITSIPLAFLGGRMMLPGTIYRVAVGLTLGFAAFRLWRGMTKADHLVGTARVPLWQSLLSGAAIGLVCGLTGVGGGIFLGPLLLLLGWADVRRAAGAAAVFNLVNSLAGLSGQLSIMAALPKAIPLWSLAALGGGWIGAEYGSHHLGSQRMQQILAVILLIAGLRLIFGPG